MIIGCASLFWAVFKICWRLCKQHQLNNTTPVDHGPSPMRLRGTCRNLGTRTCRQPTWNRQGGHVNPVSSKLVKIRLRLAPNIRFSMCWDRRRQSSSMMETPQFKSQTTWGPESGRWDTRILTCTDIQNERRKGKAMKIVTKNATTKTVRRTW